MNRKRIVSIGVVIVLLVLMIYITLLTNNHYKNEIGNHDIFTLVILEHEMDYFIEQYDSDELDDNSMELFQYKAMLLIEYLRRSPTLEFMYHPLEELIYYRTEGIDDKDIEWMRQVQQEVKKITLDLHEKSGNNNIGLLTYRYFDNEKNIKYLKELLDRE